MRKDWKSDSIKLRNDYINKITNEAVKKAKYSGGSYTSFNIHEMIYIKDEKNKNVKLKLSRKGITFYEEFYFRGKLYKNKFYEFIDLDDEILKYISDNISG